jgi:hypothetical protein
MKKTKIKDKASIRGFYRVNVLEDENGRMKVVGDSGWNENTITNSGKVNFFAEAIGAIAGSSQIVAVALGIGTLPASTETSLNGEIAGVGAVRIAVTAATTTYSGSTAVQFAFSLASGNTAMSGNIANIGLFGTTAVTTGTMLAGNTYASSALATNQAVQGTYIIAF